MATAQSERTLEQLGLEFYTNEAERKSAGEYHSGGISAATGIRFPYLWGVTISRAPAASYIERTSISELWISDERNEDTAANFKDGQWIVRPATEEARAVLAEIIRYCSD